jgi:hypothetical protein
MFYLLEDNRIIDSQEYFKYAYAYKNGITYYNVTIKKQSENVFDLIEVGDLVRYEDDFLGTTLLAEVYMNYGKLSLFDETDIKNLDILAIYKPNSNGNYIKVWEKKDGSI